uniref:EF-hand domain-containing protein n=1 Tax=Palpitomonas bilix TaxID=652834 RepID=A0A7S3D1V7_9EUKA|mmetsp:Transcript_18769/g.47571  ORF Transcript_18769/g.47571 Transcript_18769/m.47571 type:complete len:559 (+) Transcript_18769:225-1901(+)
MLTVADKTVEFPEARCVNFIYQLHKARGIANSRGADGREEGVSTSDIVWINEKLQLERYNVEVADAMIAEADSDRDGLVSPKELSRAVAPRFRRRQYIRHWRDWVSYTSHYLGLGQLLKPGMGEEKGEEMERSTSRRKLQSQREREPITGNREALLLAKGTQPLECTDTSKSLISLAEQTVNRTLEKSSAFPIPLPTSPSKSALLSATFEHAPSSPGRGGGVPRLSFSSMSDTKEGGAAATTTTGRRAEGGRGGGGGEGGGGAPPLRFSFDTQRVFNASTSASDKSASARSLRMSGPLPVHHILKSLLDEREGVRDDGGTMPLPTSSQSQVWRRSTVGSDRDVGETEFRTMIKQSSVWDLKTTAAKDAVKQMGAYVDPSSLKFRDIGRPEDADLPQWKVHGRGLPVPKQGPPEGWDLRPMEVLLAEVEEKQRQQMLDPVTDEEFRTVFGKHTLPDKEHQMGTGDPMFEYSSQAKKPSTPRNLKKKEPYFALYSRRLRASDKNAYLGEQVQTYEDKLEKAKEVTAPLNVVSLYKIASQNRSIKRREMVEETMSRDGNYE